MTDTVTIIENTAEAREDYGERYGVDEIELTAEHIAALKAGKCIASNNGEYTQFITLKTTIERMCCSYCDGTGTYELAGETVCCSYCDGCGTVPVPEEWK